MNEFGKCKDFDELRDTVQTMNSKRLQDERQEREDDQQSQTKSKTEEALSALETININSGTTRRTHVRAIGSNLSKIEQEVQKVRESLEEKDSLN